jgi:hypothetical protein
MKYFPLHTRGILALTNTIDNAVLYIAGHTYVLLDNVSNFDIRHIYTLSYLKTEHPILHIVRRPQTHCCIYDGNRQLVL